MIQVLNVGQNLHVTDWKYFYVFSSIVNWRWLQFKYLALCPFPRPLDIVHWVYVYDQNVLFFFLTIFWLIKQQENLIKFNEYTWISFKNIYWSYQPRSLKEHIKTLEVDAFVYLYFFNVLFNDCHCFCFYSLFIHVWLEYYYTKSSH